MTARLARLSIAIAIAAWSVAAAAEVSDKLPTIHDLWTQALVVGLIGLVISSVHFTTGMLALSFSLLLGWASVAILTDPFVGPSVIAEQGQPYVTAVLGSVACQLAMHGVGLGIGWWRKKRRVRPVGPALG